MNRQFDPRPIKSLLCWIVFTLIPIVKICFTDVNRNFTIEMNNSRNVSQRFKFYGLCQLIVKLRFNEHWNKFIRLKSRKRNSTMFRCNRFQIKLLIQKCRMLISALQAWSNFYERANSINFKNRLSAFLCTCLSFS